MKKVVVLCLSALLALSFAACKKKDDKKKEENKAGMGTMAPVMAPVMAAMTAPAMKAPVRKAPVMAAMAAAAAGDFKDLQVILAKQKAEIAMWTTIKTMADLKKASGPMAKLQLEIMDLQLASLKRAAALPKAKLKAYADQAKKMQAAHAGLAKTTLADRARVMKIKGAAEFAKAEQAKLMTPALKAKIAEMIKLKQQVEAKLK